MKPKNTLFLIFTFLFSSVCPAISQEAPNENIIKYIEQYAALAVKEMERTGVPASIKIAQGIHETTADHINNDDHEHNDEWGQVQSYDKIRQHKGYPGNRYKFIE